MIKASIIIPAYNCENTIKKLVDELFLTFTDENIEIVIINDASSDNTHKICINLYEKFKHKLTYARLMKNSGEHNAVMAGLRLSQGEKVFIVDDDFQNPPTELKKIYEFSYNNDYDVVYSKYPQKKHNIFRNIVSKFSNICANFFINKPKNIYLSSFKSINKSVVKKIINYDGPDPYIDGLIFDITSNIGEIEVNHYNRLTGKSGYTFRKLLKLFSNLLFNFTLIPVRFLTIMGLVMIFFSAIYILVIILEKIYNPSIPQGFATIVILLVFFFGLNLFFLGVLGEYIGKILKTVNKKPQYSISKIYKKKIDTQ